MGDLLCVTFLELRIPSCLLFYELLGSGVSHRTDRGCASRDSSVCARGCRVRIVGGGVDVTVAWGERMDDAEVLWGAKEDFTGDCAKEDEGVVGLEDDSLFSCSAVAVIGYFDNVANSDVGWVCALWRGLGCWVGLS